MRLIYPFFWRQKELQDHYANILLQEIFALNLDSYISACMEFLQSSLLRGLVKNLLACYEITTMHCWMKQSADMRKRFLCEWTVQRYKSNKRKCQRLCMSLWDIKEHWKKPGDTTRVGLCVIFLLVWLIYWPKDRAVWNRKFWWWSDTK